MRRVALTLALLGISLFPSLAQDQRMWGEISWIKNIPLIEKGSAPRNYSPMPGVRLAAQYGECGAYCNDVDPNKRQQCDPEQRPVYEDDGHCWCQLYPECK
jgi:hypothetical protein